MTTEAMEWIVNTLGKPTKAMERYKTGEIVRCEDCIYAHQREDQLVCRVNKRFVAVDDVLEHIQDAWFICDPRGFCAWGAPSMNGSEQ